MKNNFNVYLIFLFNFTIAYMVILTVTLSYTLSLLINGLLVAMLMFFRIPPVDKWAADEMLQVKKVSIIAHRGGATDAPENTLGAIRKAKQNGADGVEFDLSFTSDGIAVLLHDDSVDRTTNGTGDISSLSWAQVQTLNAASNDSARPGFVYETVPSLEEAVQVCLNLGLTMYIDCKADAKRTAQELSRLYAKYPEMYKTALVCSFYPHVIYLVRRKDPRIVTALIYRPCFLSCMPNGRLRDYHWPHLGILIAIDTFMSWAHSAFIWFLCGNSAISLVHDGCSKNVVDFYHTLGVHTVLWTVNDPDEKRFLTRSLKCDIITDSLQDTL